MGAWKTKSTSSSASSGESGLSFRVKTTEGTGLVGEIELLILLLAFSGFVG